MASMWSIQYSSTTRSVITRSSSRITGAPYCASFFAYDARSMERIFCVICAASIEESSSSVAIHAPFGKQIFSKWLISEKNAWRSSRCGCPANALVT